MATKAQLKANRANAQHSTGPTSSAGRETVSQNSTKHGLTGRFTLNTDEDHEKFMEMYKRLIRDLNATTGTECDLILRMAEALWRSERAVMLQDECIDKLSFDGEDVHADARKNLELYMRYQATHDRAYQRYAAELRKLQAEMKKAEIGFVSQKREEAHEARRAERHQNAAALEKARIEHQQLRNRELARELSPSAVSPDAPSQAESTPTSTPQALQAA